MFYLLDDIIEHRAPRPVSERRAQTCAHAQRPRISLICCASLWANAQHMLSYGGQTRYFSRFTYTIHNVCCAISISVSVRISRLVIYGEKREQKFDHRVCAARRPLATNASYMVSVIYAHRVWCGCGDIVMVVAPCHHARARNV